MSAHYLQHREDLNDEIIAFKNKPEGACPRNIAAKPQDLSMSITSKVITITPEDARKYLGNMVHNRPVSQANVKTYCEDILGGKWGLNGQGIIFDLKGRLLDGQHRMLAIIKAGKSIQMLAVYGVSDEMFSRMDIGNKRTVADVLDVRNRVPVAAAAKYIFREMKGGGIWWNTNIRFRPINGLDVLKIHPGIEESVSVATGLSGAKKIISVSPLGYCHYRAGLENKAKRDEFFQAFNTGANLGVLSPILALRNACAPVVGSRHTDQYLISLFIVAWNRYLHGGSCKFLRLPKEVPTWAVAI